MADQKLTQLPQATGAVPNDELYLVTDTGTTPQSKRITFDDLQESFTDVEVTSIQFDITQTTAPVEGQAIWNDNSKTLEIGLKNNFTLQVGMQLVELCVNKTGNTIPKGKVVYINGGSGNRPTITLADYSSDATSARTFGVTAEAIPNNNSGYVVNKGLVLGLNTNAYTAGTLLYLADDGDMTSTKPVAPNHMVYVAKVITQNSTSGVIYVEIMNGLELEELHDVLITSVADDDMIYYDNATSLWKNKTLATLKTDLNLSGTNSGDVTVTDSSTVDFTLTGQALTGSVIQSGITHNNLSGLTTGDPHTQYALLGGRIGGQLLIGGTSVNDPLLFQANTASSNTATSDAFRWRAGNNGANTRMVLRQDGALGVNNTTPTAGLHVTTGLTAVAGYDRGLEVDLNINKTTGDAIGALFEVSDVAGGVKTIYGHRARIFYSGTTGVSITGVQATSNQVFVDGGGTVSALEVLTSNLEVTNNSIVTDAKLIRLFAPNVTTGGSIGTLIGLDIPALTQGTTNWSIYSAGGAMFHTGQIRAGAGSVTTPAFSFTNTTNTGMYSRVAGELNFTASGTEELRITGGQILNVNTGTAAAPAWSFSADPDVGFYRSATNQLSISTAGVESIRVLATQGVQFRVYAGGGTTGASLDNAGGIIRTASDERLKKDITPITNALHKVKNITGIYYNWIDEEKMGSNTHIGFTAQDLLPEIPEVVFKDPSTDYYGVNYAEITALLAEGIKELSQQVEDLKSRITLLEAN